MSQAVQALRHEVDEMRRTGRQPSDIVLDLELARAGPEVAQAIWLCAIPRWFNLEILDVLRSRQPSSLSSRTLLSELLQLSFVREYAPFGYVYQQAAREALLDRWRREDAASFLAWNRRAQKYFEKRLRTTTTNRLQAGARKHAVLLAETDRNLFQREVVYHKLVVDPEAGFQGFQELFRAAERNRQYSEMQALLRDIKTQSPYLSAYRQTYLDYYAAVISLRSGQFDDARRTFTALLPMTGPSHLQSKIFYRIGELAAAEDKYNDAIQWYQRCLDSCKPANCHPWEIARVLRDLGSAYQNRRDWSQAESHYLRSLDEWKQIGDQLGIVETYNDLGNLYLLQKKPRKALTCYQESLDRLKNSPDQWRIARIYNNLGNYYGEEKQWEQALNYLRQSLEVKSSLGDVFGVGTTHYNIANVYFGQGKEQGATRPLSKKATEFLTEAAKHYELSLGYLRLVGDRSVIAQSLYYLAATYRALGENEQGLLCVDEAIALYRSLRSDEVLRAEELRGKLITGA